MPDLRVLTGPELSQAMDWAAAEGWNPGLDDAAAFRAADPEGFFGAFAGGEMVAAISVVNHDPGMAFLGLYLCRPDWRGRGVGFALWSHALAHAGERTVGLDGVPAQQANYVKSGFAPAGQTWRWQGRIDGRSDPAVREAGAADLAELLALDRAATGYDRSRFLSAWLAPAASRRTYLGHGGFATLRLCRGAAKIGPVVAPEAAAGLTLIRAAVAAMGVGEIVVDLPEGSALTAPLQALGFGASFGTARMYRGPAPRGDGTGLAVATLELG
ncbi:GNAT family N-acetyltransferase [Frigidibacter sp. MR17.14]|uniref:GNAT family N-acetyltransferase n=1 Tax=Frigidibacter sp. MR17.14 TaxID=3126509 RepID=UPI003012A60F